MYTLYHDQVCMHDVTASSLSERKSEALTTAISTLKVGDHRSLLGLK